MKRAADEAWVEMNVTLCHTLVDIMLNMQLVPDVCMLAMQLLLSISDLILLHVPFSWSGITNDSLFSTPFVLQLPSVKAQTFFFTGET